MEREKLNNAKLEAMTGEANPQEGTSDNASKLKAFLSELYGIKVDSLIVVCGEFEEETTKIRGTTAGKAAHIGDLLLEGMDDVEKNSPGLLERTLVKRLLKDLLED